MNDEQLKSLTNFGVARTAVTSALDGCKLAIEKCQQENYEGIYEHGLKLCHAQVLLAQVSSFLNTQVTRLKNADLQPPEPPANRTISGWTGKEIAGPS